tara:strand:+ start:303 stop:782 length:480 start_codon:yes stop_codon:yes gene_type:complete
MTAAYSSLSFAGGIHSHGLGNLDIAVSGKDISFILRTSIHDTVGFERQAKTEKEKAIIDERKKALSQPMAFIKIEGTKCDIMLDGIDGFEELVKKKVTDHSDIEATYKGSCQSAVAGKSIIFSFKKVVPGLKKVKLQVIGGSKPQGGKRNVHPTLKVDL